MSEKSFCNDCGIKFEGVRCPSCDRIATTEGTHTRKVTNLIEASFREPEEWDEKRRWIDQPQLHFQAPSDAPRYRSQNEFVQWPGMPSKPMQLAECLDGVWWSEKQNAIIFINNTTGNYRSWTPRRTKVKTDVIERIVPGHELTHATLKIEMLGAVRGIVMEVMGSGQLKMKFDGTEILCVKLGVDTSWLLCPRCFVFSEKTDVCRACGYRFGYQPPAAPAHEKVRELAWKWVRELQVNADGDGS